MTTRFGEWNRLTRGADPDSSQYRKQRREQMKGKETYIENATYTDAERRRYQCQRCGRRCRSAVLLVGCVWRCGGLMEVID